MIERYINVNIILILSRKHNLLMLYGLSEADKELVILRSQNAAGRNATICVRHKNLYLEKYKFLQKKCIDALGLHFKVATKNLKTFNKEDADKLNRLSDISTCLIPGQKMC